MLGPWGVRPALALVVPGRPGLILAFEQCGASRGDLRLAAAVVVAAVDASRRRRVGVKQW